MRKHRIAVMAALALAAACGGSDQLAHESRSGALSSVNGMTVNGMTVNGMTVNGMSTTGMTADGMSENGMAANAPYWNGLSANGLTADALGTTEFQNWFASNEPGYSDMVMRYIVRCALPAGQSLSFTDASEVVHTWNGVLGLAPAWAKGGAIPLVEQQLVSACLGAHTNKYGIHVNISIRGKKGDGSLIPVEATEFATFNVPEACFFGNFFDGTCVFAAPDQGFGSGDVTSPRACAIDPLGVSQCPPMAVLPSGCADYCTTAFSLDPTQLGTYSACTYNNVTYRPLNTHVQPADVYTCGDGVCQFTEMCYDAVTQTGCEQDCGSCN